MLLSLQVCQNNNKHGADRMEMKEYISYRCDLSLFNTYHSLLSGKTNFLEAKGDMCSSLIKSLSFIIVSNTCCPHCCRNNYSSFND